MTDFSSQIKENRFHRFTVQSPMPGKEITIRQTAHSFLFGSNIFGLTRKKGLGLATYKKRVKEIWNAGTLPFYWGRYEPEEGNPDPGNRVYDAALWAQKEGIRLKGHPLCWHTVCADWLLKYDNDTIFKMQMDRIRREVSRYKGIIDMWDVINEVVIMPVFNKYDNAVTRLANHIGATNLVLECFKAVREVNPDAYLLINDFDLSPAYEKLIAELLDKGCTIDAIGLQTHQHEGYRGADTVADYLERFSKFKLPLHFTENTILSGDIAPKVDDLNDIHKKSWPSTKDGEARQKEQAEEFYSQLYAHPLVEAIIWWDIEDGNWLNAPAGILRKNLSKKPSYKRLLELIKGEWWFKEQTFGGNGPIEITAPEGRYEATVAGKTYTFTLDASRPNVSIV
ncbi:MAG: endo-1,4-beta-xylanase [Spirochaetales bacterium]|nr:endo-1,4-beta-xylanase [Spirochaetales bacterium]